MAEETVPRRGRLEPRRGHLRVGAEQATRWAVRVLWVALPFTAGPATASALAGASRPVQVLASVGLWSGWAVGVVATLVALPASLTALRVAAPAVLAAVLAAATAGHADALAVGWAGVTAAWVFSPPWGALCVNGPAYPNERRFLLRAPGPLLFGPLALAWALAVGGATAGPLLLAAGRWWLGVPVTAVGFPLSGVFIRGMHDLSRRWAVFVPAGLVLHDPLTLLDPVLLRRQAVQRLGPALAGTDALDLTQRAPGLAVEARLSEEVPLTLVHPGRRTPEMARAAAVLFTPTRPGALVEEARQRRFPVG